MGLVNDQRYTKYSEGPGPGGCLLILIVVGLVTAAIILFLFQINDLLITK